MKIYRQYILFFLLLVSAVLVTLAYAQDGTDSQPDRGTSEPQARAPELGSSSNPDHEPTVFIPNHLQPASAVAEANDMEAVVYFTPQDENTSTTIVFL